jgi:NOL1/NOP2/fmu family ribosome biogenesis protein
MGGNENGAAEGLPCCPDNGRPEWGDSSLSGLADTIRLWPHKVCGEGHFAAVLEKSASAPVSDSVPAFSSCYQLQEGKLLASGKVLSDKAVSGKALSAGAPTGKVLSGKAKAYKAQKGLYESQSSRRHSGKAMPGSAAELLPLAEFLADTLTLPLSGDLTLFGEQVYLLPEGCPSFSGLRVLRPGLHLGTLLRNRFEPAHALALYLKPEQVKSCYPLHSDNEEEYKQCLRFINGEALPAQGGKGWYLVCIDGYSLGWGKLAGNLLKNHYPKGLRKSLTYIAVSVFLYSTALKASERSSMISSIFSVPMERRIVFGLIPWSISSSAFNSECVVDAG